jgi:hypothetical protein
MASISGFEQGARLIRNAIGKLDRIEAATVGNSRRVKLLRRGAAPVMGDAHFHFQHRRWAARWIATYSAAN